MKGFIEVTKERVKILVNIHHVFSIMPEPTGCRINLFANGYNKFPHIYYGVEEDYDTVKRLISEAS
jgi:hypothetical protein